MPSYRVFSITVRSVAVAAFVKNISASDQIFLFNYIGKIWGSHHHTAGGDKNFVMFSQAAAAAASRVRGMIKMDSHLHQMYACYVVWIENRSQSCCDNDYKEDVSMGCNTGFGFGGGNCCWIIILLLCCCGGFGGCGDPGCGNVGGGFGGFGGGNCCWIIILLLCCCGGFGGYGNQPC
jgi:hypothetical protein